jgi:hypothetical protein
MKTLFAALMLMSVLTCAAQTSTSTSLVADKQSGALGTIFTLTATVTDAQGPVKLGQVTFYDGDPSGPAAALGTVVLNQANGTATLKRGFTIGSHSITAKFLGTTTEASSSSSSPTITVTGQYESSTALYAEGSGNSLKLIAPVAGRGLIPITGSVTFTDTTTNTVVGNSPLNTAVLRNNFHLKSTTESNGSYAVAADFNGDGKLDLATIGPKVQVFLGKGDGTFGPGKPVPSLSTHGQTLVAGDFNGDGKQDLAILNYGAQCRLVMALGHGDGTFEVLPLVAVGVSGCPSATAGDFNNDGKLDLAVATEIDPVVEINILLGDGNGSFHGSQFINTRGVGTNWLLTADFNGDGKADLAYLPPGDILQIFIGHGNGTFAPRLDVPTSVQGIYLGEGDFNGDGKPDLVISSPARGAPSQIAVLLGHGNGTFEEVDTTVSLPDPQYMAIGDFNGDGKLDVVVLDGDETATPQYEELFGHGNGMFLSMGPVTISGRSLVEFGPTFVGDFNNDGVIDFGSEPANFTTRIYDSYVFTTSGTSTAAASLNASGSSNHTISATYSGDENFTSSQSGFIDLFQ